MDEPETPECCICMEETGPFQALFFAPCSHCYHYKCVSSIIVQSAMFQCPLCRQVANLTASVSTENLNKITDDDEIVAIGAKGDFSAKKNENQERRPSNEDVIPAVATPHAVSAIKKKKSRASSFTSRITTFLVGKKAVAASSDNETPVSGAVSDVESPTSAPLSRNQSPLRQNIAGTNTPVSQEDLDRVDILAVQLNNNYVTVSSKANPAGIPRSTTATNFQGNNVPDEEQMRSRQSSGGAVL